MIKRILWIFILLTVFFSLILFPTLAAEQDIILLTDPDAVCGRDYTQSSLLAAKLDDIFDGNASVYSDKACTALVDTALGLSPVQNDGIPKYVGSAGEMAVETGTSCWIYANGVYYTLFGESTGGGEPGAHSEKLDLQQTESRSMGYENFQAWGVRQGVGALIRASGHSVILLAYDANTITILDGNGDGNGLVAIRVFPWEKAFGAVEYIIQPREDFYAALTGTGKCGKDLVWSVDGAGTLTISGTGEIQYPGWEAYSDSIQKVVIESGGVRIGSGLFSKCSGLRQVVFQGAAPSLDANAFLGITATVYYSAAKPGWVADMLGNYGGFLTWEPYGITELKITSQPETVYVPSGAGAEVSVTAQGDGLTYTWYTKNPGEPMYIKSSAAGSIYCVTMCDAVRDRQVLCVVKDQYGNYKISQSALLRMDTAQIPAASEQGPPAP